MRDSGDHEHGGPPGGDEDEHEEDMDPGLEKGWRALEAGDVAAALAAAEAAMGEEASRSDALLLRAAAERESGDVAGAIKTLGRAAKEDPEWCTPELWLAELLVQDPARMKEALTHARRALDRAEEEDEYLAAIACKAMIELDLDHPEDARETLRGLPAPDVPLDDPETTLDLVQLLIDAGAADEARQRLETLVEAEPDLADAHYLLGVVAEELDDEDAKRAAWKRTRELDVAAMGAPRTGGGTGTLADDDLSGGDDSDGSSLLPETELIAVAEEAVAAIPERLRKHMANVPIIVAEVPAAADVAAGLDPRALGLFNGTPLGDQGAFGEAATLTEIILFRRNIARAAPDRETARDEVRTTIFPAAGHFFGLDEDALENLGLN